LLTEGRSQRDQSLFDVTLVHETAPGNHPDANDAESCGGSGQVEFVEPFLTLQFPLPLLEREGKTEFLLARR
jgi:hypothetical protein